MNRFIVPVLLLLVLILGTTTFVVSSLHAPLVTTCSELKKQYKTPIHRGSPGYDAKLDRDNDGWACE